MDVIYLLLSIAGPFLGATLWALRKSYGVNLRVRFANVFKLNANGGLYDQPLFHFGTAIPVFLFAVFGGFAWWGYGVSLTPEGFSEFIRISKLPLAMLSLIVPIGAIIASFHSTHQTAKQIVIAEQKSKMESFYQHRRELFDFFDRFEPHTYLNALTVRYKTFPIIHQIFFDGSLETGTPEMNHAAFSDMQNCLNETAELIEEVITGLHYSPRHQEYQQACYNIFEAAHLLGLKEIYKDLVCFEFELDGLSFKTVGRDVEDLLASFRYTFDFFDALCGFCGTIATRNPNASSFIYFGKRLPNKEQMDLNIIAVINFFRQVWDEVD